MQEVSLPKLGGFVVVKKRIVTPEAHLNPGTYPCIHAHLRRPVNGGHTYDSLYFPYPLDVGEWYKVNSINYPRRSWRDFNGVPWMSLALHRSKRRWCKEKVAKIVNEGLSSAAGYDHATISTISINIKATDFNNKFLWVETEQEAKKLSAELLGQVQSEPDPQEERWQLEL